ncbi:MAG: HDOD domain-containing protein, partial [Phycisphaerae bacterium]
MANESSAQNISHQVEHALYKLDGLSILPAAAAEFVRGLFEMSLSPAELNNIAEAEPSIAIMLFSLLHRNSINIDSDKISISSAVTELSLRTIRDSFFAAKIYAPSQANGSAFELRKNLIIFANAVAYCSREIAEQGSVDVNGDTAYLAGLLHNIGNLALDEAMPRSFQSMFEQAKENSLNICDVQRQNLHLDYTTIGKRLAQKWHLPEQITTAIWLHQSNTEAIARTIPKMRIAHIVRLAYLLVKQAKIGTSASFDSSIVSEQILNSAGITGEQAVQIASRAFEIVAEKSKYFGKEINTDIAAFCKAISSAASQLACDTSKLTAQVQQSHTKASHFDFTSEFLTALEPDSEPMEIAEHFACQFKKFYQTGKVCLYLTNQNDSTAAQALIVDEDNNVQVVQINLPSDKPAVPKDINGNFSVIDAAQRCGWIFEQIPVDFDVNQTKIAPLIAKSNAIGALLFEFRYPVQTSQLQEMFKATANMAAFLLDMAIGRQKQQYLAEDFVRLIGVAEEPKEEPVQKIQPCVLDILAEMAAGAAHELNNPLAVISGRAQLLSQSEDDQDKKQSLMQIQANCRQLADIVNDLMSFAQPVPPRKTNVSLKQLVEEALQLASLKTSLD